MIRSFLVAFLAAVLAFFTLGTPDARAQAPADWQFVPGAVLSPDPGFPYMSQSIGSPAVVYDTLRGRFLMFFESKTTTIDARCPQGVWALGAAWSNDGVNWTPFPSAVLTPNPTQTKWWSCAISHPTAIFSPTAYAGAGGVFVMVKGEQRNDACAVVAPSWGCDVLTGIGRMQVQLDASGDPIRVFAQATPNIEPTVATFGYPKLVQKTGVYRVLYQGYPDIWSTFNTTPGVFPAGNNAVEIAHADAALAVTWARNELFNPSLLCGDDPVYTYASFVGGRATQGATIVSGGWGKAIDDVWGGLNAFLLDATAQQEWMGNDAWRHWDVTRLTTGEYLVWFDEKDAFGNNFIRFGGTTLTFNNADVVSKICP